MGIRRIVNSCFLWRPMFLVMTSTFGLLSLSLMQLLMKPGIQPAELEQIQAHTVAFHNGTWKWDELVHHQVSDIARQSIPKIIHQTFSTERIYGNYKEYIASCLKLNPDWKYYLWRDKDALALIKDHYPYFLDKYKSYTDNLEPADAIRYVVLHHFGGIYLDMDVECLKPFYPGLSHLPAFLDMERVEQTRIIWSKSFTVMNSVMGSVKGHPFFRFVITGMLENPLKGTAMTSTGPNFLNKMYNMYSQTLKTTSDYTDFVFPMPSDVFSPLMDTEFNWPERCKSNKIKTEVQKAGCRTLASKGWRLDETGGRTIGIHQFLHLGYGGSANTNRKPSFNLTEAFPDRVHFYSP